MAQKRHTSSCVRKTVRHADPHNLFFHHKTSAVPGKWLHPGWTGRRTAGCSAGCRCPRGWPASVFPWVCGQFPDAGRCSELACCNLRNKRGRCRATVESLAALSESWTVNSCLLHQAPDLRCLRVLENNSVNLIFASDSRTSVPHRKGTQWTNTAYFSLF